MSEDQLMCWPHWAFSVNGKKAAKARACVNARAYQYAHEQHNFTQHEYTWTHTHRLPMRQMRSERSHIKQPNLSCFAFIAPVHFHNALKPPLRREGDMERRGERWRGGREEWRHRERNGKEGRGDKKHSQSNLKLVDVWGCEETR